ncbi:MAG: 4-hydroxy-tetrahydrodipicolinate reductase [Lachnospiraceae bacterium]
MIKVIIHGCNGKMGQVITGLCKEDSSMQVVAGIDPFSGRENEYPVFSCMEACNIKADVVIDFASAAAVDGLLRDCVNKRLPVVLCTTGLTDEQLLSVREAAVHTPVLKSANMSLGINVLMNLLKEAAAILAPAGFDMEIIERHHNQKIDSPSGTALALADVMNTVLGQAYEYKYDRTQQREKRDKKEIGISSVRGGTIVGEHEVIFAGIDEVIEVKHTAYSRTVFGKGAVEAAKFLAGKTAGYYDMQDVVAAGK